MSLNKQSIRREQQKKTVAQPYINQWGHVHGQDIINRKLSEPKEILSNAELDSIARTFADLRKKGLIHTSVIDQFIIDARGKIRPTGFDEDRFLRAYRHYAGIQRVKGFKY